MNSIEAAMTSVAAAAPLNVLATRMMDHTDPSRKPSRPATYAKGTGFASRST